MLFFGTKASEFASDASHRYRAHRVLLGAVSADVTPQPDMPLRPRSYRSAFFNHNDPKN
jgi:hypothetical protein